MYRMARMRLAHKGASTPVESGEGPSGDLGGVPSGWARDQTEFLAGHEVRTAATGDSSVRDGDGGPASTTSEQARAGMADIIRPDAGVDEDAASDSDDEEYTAPLDELLASYDSEDPLDDGGSEDEGGGNGK
ncbi:hypothetical protein MRB53_009960 [Persea americana]|uniref:Uncharacterized protein n=1 Tax=Persea americana TaxID=3435 RepID=A0ACC2LQK7_PERAE|nr:hypothetical protein MRB53_009960 [Persea americana]